LVHPTIKRRGFFLALFSIGLLTLCGCAVLEQYLQMATLSKCQFRLASVEGTTLAGIPLQGKTKSSDLGLLQLTQLQTAFLTGSLPLAFTLNIEVKNPNSSAAGINKFAWILSMDDMDLTSGLLERQVTIQANGGTGTIPLNISLDTKKVLSGKSWDSILNLAMNIAGEGNKPSKLSLKLKPSILIAGQELSYPDYLTVSHTFSTEK